MAKISARGARPVLSVITRDRNARYVLCSDGRLLYGYRRPEGGYSYTVVKHYKRETLDRVAQELRNRARNGGFEIQEGDV